MQKQSKALAELRYAAQDDTHLVPIIKAFEQEASAIRALCDSIPHGSEGSAWRIGRRIVALLNGGK